MNRDTNLPIDTVPTPHVDRLRKLLDYLEPVDSPTDEQAAVVARVADALTLDQVVVLGEYVEDIRSKADHSGWTAAKKLAHEGIDVMFAKYE